MRTAPTLAALGLLLAAGCATAEEPVAYPEGYRSWSHVKSMVILPGHALYESFGGIHHVYANERGLEGYRTGTFPDGSVLVFDLLEAVSQEGAIVEGPRKVLGVMERDRRRFPETQGWGFEGFAAGDPTQRAVGDDAKEACFACHQGVADHDFVFSRWRD